MTKKNGLGRGLDALFSENEDASGGDIRMIDITLIDRNPRQPRRSFDDAALAELADSIRSSGVLQPLLVVPDRGRYRIVAGERRFRAARLAGLSSVPCLARDMTPEQQMEAALIENLQRENLNAIEEASGIQALIEQCGYTQEKAARQLGKSRPALTNLLRLLRLPETVRAAVARGDISAGHARVLAGLDDVNRQIGLCEITIAEGLSVRALEKLAATPAPAAPPKKEKRPLPLELADMETRFREAVGVRAVVTGNRKKGKIVLQYQTEDELEKIYLAMEKIERGQ